MIDKQAPALIAVVDDDKTLLESISDLLASAGYATLSFSTAQELLDCKELPSVKCLISDIVMPGINGWQLVALLRKQQPKLPIMLITAHDPTEWGAMAHPNHVSTVQVLRKPFEAQSLLNAVLKATAPST